MGSPVAANRSMSAAFDRVTADDLAAARSIGGTIKAVVSAERDADGIRAFVGPVFLPSTEPLASLGGALNGIRLDGRHVSNLFFSGPGAGPDVTAATLLDDAVQAASYRAENTRAAGAFVTAGLPVVASHGVVSPGHVSGRAAWRRRDRVAGRRAGLAGGARRRPRDRHTRGGCSSARKSVVTSTRAIAKLANTHRIDAAAFRGSND